MPKKRRVANSEFLGHFSDYFDGKVTDLIGILQVLVDDNGDDCELRDSRHDAAWYDDGVSSVYLISYRDETNAEMNKRLAKAAKAADYRKKKKVADAKKKKAKELKELQRLKKKYEK